MHYCLPIKQFVKNETMGALSYSALAFSAVGSKKALSYLTRSMSV